MAAKIGAADCELEAGAGCVVNHNMPPPPVFSDVWQGKDLREGDFVSVAAKGVTGAIFVCVAGKGLRTGIGHGGTESTELKEGVAPTTWSNSEGSLTERRGWEVTITQAFSLVCASTSRCVSVTQG